jgi:hypothetical protein
MIDRGNPTVFHVGDTVGKLEDPVVVRYHEKHPVLAERESAH